MQEIAWYCVSVVPALRTKGQEGHKYQTSQDYTAGCYLSREKKKEGQRKRKKAA